MTGAAQATVHQQRPPKANVIEPLIYSVCLEKESDTINGKGDYKFIL
jgi:hypothetical protein